jgi:hypothetical protein
MTKTWRGRPTPETIAALNKKREARIAASEGHTPAPEIVTVKRARKTVARLVGESLLTQGVEYKDVRMAAMELNFAFGSKALCAAILAAGRTHGPMTEAEQIEAVRYAHGIK